MSRRTQSKNLDIDHVRNPCQWMPVIGMNGCEGPSDSLPRETRGYGGISSNVCMVIEIDNESVKKNRRINGDDNN